MRNREATPTPAVWLGHTGPDSIAVSIYVLLRDGARRRPGAATSIRASIRIRFADERHPAVRIDFRGDEIEVADDRDAHAACDLELRGRLGDIAALVAAPRAGGLPNPATSGGLQAIMRLADGRVELVGSLVLAYELLNLLAVDADRAPARRTRTLARRRASTRAATRRRDHA